jgi:hypothetical protein
MTEDPNEPAHHRVAIFGAIAVVTLVVLGWVLVRELSASARLQDCVMSGRTNCAPIETR